MKQIQNFRRNAPSFVVLVNKLKIYLVLVTYHDTKKEKTSQLFGLTAWLCPAIKL